VRSLENFAGAERGGGPLGGRRASTAKIFQAKVRPIPPNAPKAPGFFYILAVISASKRPKNREFMPLALSDILFAISALAVILLSLSVVLARNPVRSTLLLILSFVPVSVIYILMQAAFVGVLQILVYAGAIMMLFTFVIMMINPEPNTGEIPGEPAVKKGWRGEILAVLVLVAAGLVLIPQVYWAASRMPVAAVEKPGFGGLKSLSQFLFADPANNPLTVSFELISFLILVGIIASINFSRREKSAPTSGEN
jgi:NADH-quinone oxidoreductase subunit J